MWASCKVLDVTCDGWCVFVLQKCVRQWRYKWLSDTIFDHPLWSVILCVFELPLGWYEQAVDWWHWAGCLAQFWLSERWPAPRTSAEIKILFSFKSQGRGNFMLFVCPCTFYLLSCLYLLNNLRGNSCLHNSWWGAGVRHTVTWVKGALWRTKRECKYISLKLCHDSYSY